MKQSRLQKNGRTNLDYTILRETFEPVRTKIVFNTAASYFIQFCLRTKVKIKLKIHFLPPLFLFFSWMHIINTRHGSYHKEATTKQRMTTARKKKTSGPCFILSTPQFPAASPRKTERNSVRYSLIKKR
jgi:hypothetical protein